MSIILVLLLLFISVHRSCNARLLRVARHDDAHANEFQQYSLMTKENDVEKKVNNGGRERRSEEKDEHETDSGSERWRKWIPHAKRGAAEEAAGFNLDYLPPRTHPPVHN